MKITISGKPGSGKSTIASALCSEFGLKYYSIGEIFRKIAAKTGKNIVELNKYPDNVDSLVDNEQKLIGKENDNFVMDSRLGFYFIPDAIHIYLDVDPEVAAQRILKADRKHEKYVSLEEAKNKLMERHTLERERYLSLYGIDADDRKNYDLYIDTTTLRADEVLEQIIDFIKKKNQADYSG